jgi:hypothetical protein
MLQSSKLLGEGHWPDYDRCLRLGDDRWRSVRPDTGGRGRCIQRHVARIWFERDSARSEKHIFDFAMALPAGPTYMDAQRQAS